ncbi:hypothetical protein B0I26_103280 [Anoxybacillus vitaminiphilus]|uniref:Uncharacterized protein n=1 Tax=Paranoxybacillus vitaminiphilus TaxID=581036 RepID=A0A327YLP0_9BACL|nr:hypothetical protein [Anoxybacillus vitaminiphilus]RAK21322.1 hypothetical protein B0I26_103280 [Anoxybacillus vitaminiphilus]
MNFFLHLLRCEQKQSLPFDAAGSQLVDKVDKRRSAKPFFDKKILTLIIVLYYNLHVLMKIIIN